MLADGSDRRVGTMGQFAKMKRTDVMAYRIAAQQLDRAESSGRSPMRRSSTSAFRTPAGTARAGRWPTAASRWPARSELEGDSEVALAWTLRGAPHYYRRAELPDVMVATSPFSDKDAAKRIIGADKPLQGAGIGARDGLAEVASQMRTLVTKPMVKGEVSTRLTAALDDPYLRYCVPCGAVHAWEMPFRLGALYGGLELEPGTSPPVLRRIPGWPRRTPGPADDPLAAPEHLQPIRNYLRFLGPATPQRRGRLPGRAGGRDQGALARGRGRGRPSTASGGGSSAGSADGRS